MLCLQSGKFDVPERLFHSIDETWQGVFTNSADVKELIPEFYCVPSEPESDFLVNFQDIQFGSKQSGELIDDVVLPPWAKDANEFHAILSEALESDYVSAHLHSWIDLIFGYKQLGEDAEKAFNVFHPMTTMGAESYEFEGDETEKLAREIQIREFGQTPKQMWTQPHPQRLPRQSEDTKRDDIGTSLATSISSRLTIATEKQEAESTGRHICLLSTTKLHRE
jgi:factor associated with neutral sphingomyelinase activation